jgi:hypothetical protein
MTASQLVTNCQQGEIQIPPVSLLLIFLSGDSLSYIYQDKMLHYYDTITPIILAQLLLLPRLSLLGFQGMFEDVFESLLKSCNGFGFSIFPPFPTQKES